MKIQTDRTYHMNIGSLADCELEERSTDGDTKRGTLRGWGNVWSVVDSYGTQIRKGAFADSLKNRSPAFLLEHDHGTPIGRWEKFEEKDRGLWLEGDFMLTMESPSGATLDYEPGVRAWNLAKNRIMNGLSVGFSIRDRKWMEYDEKTGVVFINRADLLEVSLCTFPANSKSLLTGVRSASTIREMERSLRDAGLSVSEAKYIVSLIDATRLEGAQSQVHDELAAVSTQLDELIKTLGA
jgi:HK97 family phage prohead protease